MRNSFRQLLHGCAKFVAFLRGNSLRLYLLSDRRVRDGVEHGGPTIRCRIGGHRCRCGIGEAAGDLRRHRSTRLWRTRRLAKRSHGSPFFDKRCEFREPLAVFGLDASGHAFFQLLRESPGLVIASAVLGGHNDLT